MRQLANTTLRFCIVFVISLTHLFATDFFLTRDDLWFDQNDKQSVKALIEMKYVAKQQALQFFQSQLPSSIFQKMKISEISAKDEDFIRIHLFKMRHAELMTIRDLLPALQNLGAQSLSPELPFAIRLIALKGHYDFISSVTGLPKKTIKEINMREEHSRLTGEPILIRYFQEDVMKTQNNLDLLAFFGDAILTYIPANTYGLMPLYVSGNSIVFHKRTFHDKTILGRINPGLVNAYISQAIENNKYVEALFWKQYVPDVLPETFLLASLNLNFDNPPNVQCALDQLFPEGWVLKGVCEAGCFGSLITDKIDLDKELKIYKSSHFDIVKARLEKELAGSDDDTIFYALGEHRCYRGWKINYYLQHPEQTIVQKKMEIDKEFRVEIINGRLLKGGTVDRYNFLCEGNCEVSSKKLLDEVGTFAQEIVNQLPDELKEMSFGMDIALLKDKRFIIIESNPGCESGFLLEERNSVIALNRRLKNETENKAGLISPFRGLEAKTQMTYLDNFFRSFDLDPQVHFPVYQFTENQLITQYQPVLFPEIYRMKK